MSTLSGQNYRSGKWLSLTSLRGAIADGRTGVTHLSDSDGRSQSQSQGTSPSARKVFIVAGPGGSAFGKDDISSLADAFRQRGGEVCVAGDGDHTLSLDSLKTSFSNFADASDDVSIFVAAHGKTIDGFHHLKLEHASIDTPTSSLFDVIRPAEQGAGKRDLFFASCEARSALSHMAGLPPGSDGVSLAASDAGLWRFNLKRFAECTKENDNHPLTSQGFLDTYLSDMLEDRSEVFLYTTNDPDNRSQDILKPLYRQFTEQLGRQFTAGQTASVCGHWNSRLGSDRCKELMSKISSTRSDWDVPAKDLGACMAIVNTARDFSRRA